MHHGSIPRNRSDVTSKDFANNPLCKFSYLYPCCFLSARRPSRYTPSLIRMGPMLTKASYAVPLAAPALPDGRGSAIVAQERLARSHDGRARVEQRRSYIWGRPRPSTGRRGRGGGEGAVRVLNWRTAVQRWVTSPSGMLGW